VARSWSALPAARQAPRPTGRQPTTPDQQCLTRPLAWSVGLQVRNPDALRRLACCDPLGDLPLILRHIVCRPKSTAISSSAHANPICGCQTCCFLLVRLHGLPVDLLKETKQQHAFAPCLESLRHGGLRASLLPSTMCTICDLPWPKGNTDIPTRLRSNKSMQAGNVVGCSHRLPQVGMKLQ
jgi:hypothetical protein